jgi:RHS repeat-associated protein
LQSGRKNTFCQYLVTNSWKLLQKIKLQASAKIINEEKYSIISDYIGRPVQAFSDTGKVVWETDYDIYGGLRNLKGDKCFVPFRQLGQYEDGESALYYNRFRYYSAETGSYLSQDPLKYWGGMNLYSYVQDSNKYVDIFGWEDILFRSLSKNDMTSLDSGGNIVPKDPTATRSAYDHVLNGSTDGYADQYVSLTKDRKFAERWAKKSVTDVVEIDLDKVANNKIDLSTADGRKLHLGDVSNNPTDELRKVNKFAKGAEELLVEGEVNNSAIVKRYNPRCS